MNDMKSLNGLLKEVQLLMSKLRFGHFLFLIYAIFVNIILAWMIKNPSCAIFILVWLGVPCLDRQFGNGMKYYKVRQSVIIIGAICAFIIGLV